MPFCCVTRCCNSYRVHKSSWEGRRRGANHWKWTGFIEGLLGHHHQGGRTNTAMPCRSHNLQWNRCRRGSNQGDWTWPSSEQPDPDQQYGGSRNTSQATLYACASGMSVSLGILSRWERKLGVEEFLGDVPRMFGLHRGGCEASPRSHCARPAV